MLAPTSTRMALYLPLKTWLRSLCRGLRRKVWALSNQRMPATRWVWGVSITPWKCRLGMGKRVRDALQIRLQERLDEGLKRVRHLGANPRAEFLRLPGK